MSYNGSGTFTINSTGQPVVAGTVITASAFNALTADLATGLTTAITKDGQTTTTARITFAQGVTSSLVTDSSSTSTGSIITAGGVGIAKALYVGTTATVSQITSASATALTLQSAGTTAITVSTAQNVGIGTVSPACKADVAGAIRTTSTGAPASGVGLELSYGGTANTADILSYDRTGATFKDIEMRCSNLIFNTGGGGERARFDSSGNLLMGTTSGFAGRKFQVNGGDGTNFLSSINNTASSGAFGFQVYFSASAPNGTSNQFYSCGDTSTTRFEVRSNGGIANFAANNVILSDRREKINFAPAKSYLDVICSIPVQTYNYIDQNMEDDGGLTLGVVAQDVQAVAPELVADSDWSAEKDGSKMRLSIYQTDLQYALMKSIQELKTINDTQAETINALTARIVALEAK